MSEHSADKDAGPVYDEPVHACPPAGSGIMPCCGRTPLEVPLTDRMTSTGRVTCAGVTPPGERLTPPDSEQAR